jgi:hypothetical protein
MNAWMPEKVRVHHYHIQRLHQGPMIEDRIPTPENDGAASKSPCSTWNYVSL